MQPRFFILPLLILLALPAICPAAGPLRVACGNDQPRYQFVDTANTPQGLIPDLWRLWGQATSTEIQFITAPARHLTALLADGEADIVGGIPPEETTAQGLVVGPTLARADVHVFHASTLQGISTLRDLRPYRIGILHSDSLDALLADMMPGVELTMFTDMSGLLRSAQRGSLQAFVVTDPAAAMARDELAANGFRQLNTSVVVTLAPALQQGDTARLNAVRSGFAAIPQALLHETLARWQPTPQGKNAAPLWPWVLLAVFALGTGTVVLRRLHLRSKLPRTAAPPTAASNNLSGAQLALPLQQLLQYLPGTYGILTISAQGIVASSTESARTLLALSASELAVPFRNLLATAADGTPTDTPTPDILHSLQTGETLFSATLRKGQHGSMRCDILLVPAPLEGYHYAVLLDRSRPEAECETILRTRLAYEELVGNAPVAMFRATASGKLLSVNTEFARMWGSTSPEAMVRDLTNLEQGLYADPSTRAQLLRELDERGLVDNREVALKQRNGTPFWGLISFRRVEDENGELQHTGYLLDITPLKHAQDQLRFTKRRLEDIVDFMPDALFVLDAHRRVIAWNKAMERLTGVLAKDMLGQGNYAYSVPFFGERAPMLCDRIFVPDLPLRFEAKVLYRHGTSLVAEGFFSSLREGRGAYIWSAASPLLDDDGQLTGAIQVLRDVSDRREQLAALEDSEQRYQLAVSATNDGIWEWNITTKQIYYSPRCREILGIPDGTTPERLMAHMPEVLHPADRLRVISECTAVAAGKNDKLVTDFRIRHTDGTWRWVQGSGTVLRNAIGRIARVAGAVSDITERKQSEAINSILFQISNAVNATRDLDELFQSIHHTLREHIAADNFFIALHDRKLDRLDFPYFADEQDPGLPVIQHVSTLAPEIPSIMVLRSGKSVLLTGDEIARRPHIGTRCAIWLGTPLRIRGEVIGLMTVQDYHDTMAFSERDRDLLISVADQVALAIERKRNEEQLTHLALHDGLTGLPNRVLLNDRIDKAIQRMQRTPAAQFAVLMLDLDRFKVINDTHGHDIGDKLLQELARRILPTVRANDTVARLGGDEFALLLEDVASPREVITVVRRIQKAIVRPMRIGNKLIRTAASIGIILRPQGYVASGELLRDADIAMYQAKAQGKGSFRVFNKTMHRRTMESMSLENELSLALRRRQLYLDYQPIFSCADMRLRGFEALVRWRHPVHGLVSPSRFIPIAEETGIIQQLGQWVLENAIADLAQWRKNMTEAQNLRVAVNLSARQTAQANLASMVDDLLREADLPPSALQLEITETALMHEPNIALQRISALRKLGIAIGIDDFGTGYSSLSYLQRFPVDILKVDRSFVSPEDGEQEENREIVRAVVALAQSLSLQVVAEGVETHEQLAFIRSLGCDGVQGFLLARPLRHEDIPGFILACSQRTTDSECTVPQ